MRLNTLDLPGVRPTRTGVTRAQRVFQRTRGARVPIVFLGVVVTTAVFAPLIAPYSPNAIDPSHDLQGPSATHWFGTDVLGRDLFSRVLYGGRLSLGIALAATLLGTAAGMFWGATAALGHRWLDEILMRVVDGLLGIPILLSALVFVAAFNASIVSLGVILAAVFTPPTARVFRAATIVERAEPYCLAANAAGASRLRLFCGEILPNLIPTMLVQSTIVFSASLLTEAGLSFLGLGVPPPQASWGSLLYTGYQQLYTSYWFITFPGLLIPLSIWAANGISDHVQEQLDPRVRNITRMHA